MKKIMILIFAANLLLAIEQVPRQRESADKDTNQNTEVRTRESKKNPLEAIRNAGSAVMKTLAQPDRFQDKDSNGVNDRREEDFQNIKTRKSRFKELLGKKETEPEKKKGDVPPRTEKDTDRAKEK